jgi:hypothetical protein
MGGLGMSYKRKDREFEERIARLVRKQCTCNPQDCYERQFVDDGRHLPYCQMAVRAYPSRVVTFPAPPKQKFMTPMRWMYLAVISAFIAGFLTRGL